jgi:hypothetical protein
MTRIVTPVSGNPISSSTFGVPLRNDYLSQTDTNDQSVAGKVTFSGSTVGAVKLAPKYTVYKVGSTYYAMDEDGNITTDSSLGDLVNDEVFNGLSSGRTWQETVLLKGGLTLDDTLLIPSYTTLKINGKITLANSVNKDMFRNLQYNAGNDNYISILSDETAVIDGNKANQASGSGIVLYNTSYDLTADVLCNLQVQNCKTHGFDLQYLCSAFLRDISAYGNGGRGMSMTICNDNVIRGFGVANGAGYELYLNGSSTNDFSQMYLGGINVADEAPRYPQLCIFQGSDNIIQGRIDYCGGDAAYVGSGNGTYPSNGNKFDLIITDLQATTNTFYAMFCEGYASHNIFKASVRGDGADWNTIAKEAAAAGGTPDYNVFYVDSAENFSTLSALTGAHSKVVQGWTT